MKRFSEDTGPNAGKGNCFQSANCGRASEKKNSGLPPLKLYLRKPRHWQSERKEDTRTKRPERKCRGKPPGNANPPHTKCEVPGPRAVGSLQPKKKKRSQNGDRTHSIPVTKKNGQMTLYPPACKNAITTQNVRIPMRKPKDRKGVASQQTGKKKDGRDGCGRQEPIVRRGDTMINNEKGKKGRGKGGLTLAKKRAESDCKGWYQREKSGRVRVGQKTGEKSCGKGMEEELHRGTADKKLLGAGTEKKDKNRPGSWDKKGKGSSVGRGMPGTNR